MNSFGGGVVLFGSPDAQHPDEVAGADSYEIGPRGQLVATSDVSDYYTLKDVQAVPVAWTALHGLGSLTSASLPFILAVGEGKDVTPTLKYILAYIRRQSEAVPIPAAQTFTFDAPAVVPNAHGVYVTSQQFPGLYFAANFVLVNIGAREGNYPVTAPGLWFLALNPATGAGYQVNGGAAQSCLGIGTGAAGTHAVQLFFRGIVGYNGFAWGWGFDSADATNGDGPNRVMFSNYNNPLMWGNDNQSVAADRAFTDSDAIVLGDAGEIIRAALKWNGKLYFGTNAQVHYIAGFGRDSFLTDGANPVAKSYNVVGPQALIEGPDKLMYGVADQGLWNYDGATFTPIFQKLVNFAGHSPGYWDLMWNDPTLALGNPGRTNQDLVWTAVDWERFQVLVGIPFCNATLGYGIGTDTVVIKYHPRTGGFTRQVFLGQTYTAASYVRRAGQQRESRILGTATTGKATIQRYGYQVTPTTSPILPTQLPVVQFGPYEPFGSDGSGVVRRCYLTIAWESSASLPLVFGIVTTADVSVLNSFALTISQTAPASPAAGDVWLDTSQTDTSIGNATAGVTVPATGGYLAKTYSGTAWRFIAGSGEEGTRATIPLPLARRTATRVTVTATCLTATGRYQIESLGLEPGGGTPNA